MPTTATPKNYDIKHIHQGPGDLWLISPAPVDSVAPTITLAADGTPDATTFPQAVHLGAMDSAVTVSVKPKIEDITIDQAAGPVGVYLTAEEMSIEADFVQLDPKIMQNLMPFCVFSTQATPGYNMLTFGDQPLPAAGQCVAFISPKRAVSGCYIVSVLFSGIGMLGLSTAIGRAKKSSYKGSFKGLTDMTRTAGRRIGVVYETL